MTRKAFFKPYFFSSAIRTLFPSSIKHTDLSVESQKNLKKKVEFRNFRNVLIIGITTLLLIGCVTIYNPATGREERHLFDEQFEINLGNVLAKQMVSQTQMISDLKALTYLRGVGEKVAAASHCNHLNHNFYIIDSAEINAYSILGGHVFVNKGLLDTFSEPELSFVLAHEIAHVCARHGFKRFQAALGLNLLMAVLSSEQPNQKTITDLVAEVDKYVFLGFSRKDEYQADDLGISYAYQAGFDPEASLLVFKRFEELEKKQGAESVPVFLCSHPEPAERYKAAKIKIESLTGTQPL